MQISVRSYLTAGIAAVGATAIIAGPVAPVTHAPALAAPSMSVVAPDVQLASFLTDVADSINDVISGFQSAGGIAVSTLVSVNSLVYSTTQVTISNTGSILQTILNSLYAGTSAISGGFVNAANVFLPSPFDAALSDLYSGFTSAASILNGGAGSLISLGTGALLALNSAGYQLTNYALQYPFGAVDDIIEGFKKALDSAAALNFGQAVTDVIDGFASAASLLVNGAQASASVISSTASTLWSYTKSAAGVLIQTPINAVKAIYAGIKAAFAEFGIPLPFAAVKPKAVPAAAPAAAVALAPAKVAAASEATDVTDEQAPAPKAAKPSPKKAAAARRPVASTASAVAGQHDSPDSSSSGRSETKHGSDRAGESRASRHDAA